MGRAALLGHGACPYKLASSILSAAAALPMGTVRSGSTPKAVLYLKGRTGACESLRTESQGGWVGVRACTGLCGVVTRPRTSPSSCPSLRVSGRIVAGSGRPRTWGNTQ